MLPIQSRDPYREAEPYSYQIDDELEAILAQANGNGMAAFRGWFASAKPHIAKEFGVNMVPGPIQQAAGLPVRQVFVYYDSVYRIETDGRVTTQLV